jgi:predicted GIY-YIG superfamily endonuclease
MTDSINWAGKSGNLYQYWIYPIDTSFKSSPGNYIYTKHNGVGWVPLYMGQTVDLAARLSNHEKDSEARRNGATHIHAHTSGSEAERLAEERDLCAKWKPICNDQLVA